MRKQFSNDEAWKKPEVHYELSMIFTKGFNQMQRT